MPRLAIAFPLIALLLVGCARSEDAATVANVDGADRAVEGTKAPAEDDEEVAIGEWRESLQDEFAALEFGPAGATPLFSLRCDDRGGVLLQRHGTAATGDLPVMLVTIGNETRRLPVITAGGTIPMLRAVLPPRDPLLATFRAPSPITVRIGDAAPLVLPPSPTIGTFVSVCASGGGRPDRAEAETNGVIGANLAEPTANTTR